MKIAGDSLKSSILGLKDKPKHAIIGFLFFETKKSFAFFCIFSITQLVFSKFLSLPNLIILDSSLSELTINHGSTAIQCPPTPEPGLKFQLLDAY